MEDLLIRVWNNMIARVEGPMNFRLFLQPTMATIFAIRSGLKDAREGRPVYFWSIFGDPLQRKEILKDGWKSVGKVFVLAIVLDAVFQVIALHWIYPLEALIVAFILAIVPYLAIRGITCRIARQSVKPSPGVSRL
jgi:hypothetical protein